MRLVQIQHLLRCMKMSVLGLGFRVKCLIYLVFKIVAALFKRGLSERNAIQLLLTKIARLFKSARYDKWGNF